LGTIKQSNAFSTSDSIGQKCTFVFQLTFNWLIDFHFRQLRSFLFVPAIFKDFNLKNLTSASCEDVVICINTEQIKPFSTSTFTEIHLEV